MISHYLPKITEQLATRYISESMLFYYMDILEEMEGGEAKIDQNNPGDKSD